MMKNILLIFFLFLSYNVVAQRFPAGTPTQFSTGWFRQGYQQSDSGTIVAKRDTLWNPRFSGTIVFRPQDRQFYYYDSTDLRWYKFNTGTYRFGIEDNTTTQNRVFNFNGYSFLGDSSFVYRTGTKTQSTGVDKGLYTKLELDNQNIYLIASPSGGPSPRSYGFSAHQFLTNMFARGHISGHDGYVQADTLQVLLESDPNRIEVRHDSVTINNFNGEIDLRIRTLPQTVDTSQWKPVAIGPLGQIKRLPGWPTAASLGGLTSVGLSMPSAFSVTNTPLTSNGTISVSGAGTSAQYIRGNGTLATTDTGMIPNFHLKVRSLLSGTSPITFNQTTGIIGILRANTTGQLGAATFVNSDFSDNGSGLISLSPLVSAGSCTGCNLNIGIDGRITGYTDGPAGATNNTNIGAGFRILNSITQEIRTLFAGFGQRIDSVANVNGLTWSSDTTRITGLPTYFYVDSLLGTIPLVNNGISKNGDTVQLGSSNISGSPLNHETYINTGGYTLYVQGSNAAADILIGNNTGTGGGIRGSSIDAYGVSGTSNNLYGVYGTSTISHAIQGWTTNGNTAGYLENTSSSTNTVNPTLQIKRTTSGTAAAGIGSSIEYYVEKDNGANNTPSHTLRSILTDPASGNEDGQFELYGVNNATLSRKFAISSVGQWIWDGYPSLTAQIDTTTYKPIAIDGSGNVVKMAAWTGGGGGTPSWQQTLNVSNITSSTLVHDTTLVGNPVEKLWNIYYPLVKTDTVTDPFFHWQFSGSNNGSFNEVMNWGWNMNPGGGPMTLGHPVIGESWESNYQINPDGHSDRLVEKHEIYVSPAGDQYRLSSYTINSNTGTIDYYHRIGTFSLRNIDSNTPFYSILGVSNYTSQTFINSSDQASYFSQNSVFAQDANTASFTILGGNAGKPNILYNVDGFTYGYLPSTQVSGAGYDGAEIAFNGVTSGVLAKLLSDSARTTLTNFTNVPISFVINGITSMELRSARVNISQPTAIGAGITTPIAELDVRSNSQDQTAYIENGKNGGYAGIFTATGSAGGNVGLDITAIGTSANKGINFNTSMTANDWNIFSAGSSKAYLAGKVGIGTGNTSPDSTLSVIGSFHTTAGVRMDNLPRSGGTNAVRYDPSTGNISYADTSSGGAATTLYNGDGTLAGNRTVTGSNNDLTFLTLDQLRFNANTFVFAKNNASIPYTGTITGAGNQFTFGYTPSPGIFTKGIGYIVDTNNNISIGDANIPSTAPLYSGPSAYIGGLQSEDGNFYRVNNITTDITLGLQNNFLVIDATSGNITITLPAASSAFGANLGYDLIFKRIDNSGNTVTVQRAGSDLIDGANSFTLTTQWEAKKLRCLSTSTWGLY